MRTKRNLQKIKSFTVFITPIAIFILLFSKMNIPEFISCLKEINVVFLLAGILISIFVEIFIPSIQWQRILHALNCPLNLKEALFIRVGSRPAKSLLPFKSGELARAFYLKKQRGFPVSLGISSLFFQLILNFLVLVIIMSLAYILFIRPSYLILFFLLLSFLCILYILSFRLIKKFILYFAKRVGSRFYNSVDALFKIYRKFKLKDLAAIVSYSVIIWVGGFITFIVIFKAVGLDVPVYAILIFVPLIIIISNIPITISGLGTREAALVFLFYEFGTPERLLSSGVLISFVQFSLPLIFSLLLAKTFLNRLYYISEPSQST